MSQRIAFEFYGGTDQDQANWNQVKQLLKDFGGELLPESSKSPRTLIRAKLPNERSAQEVAKRLRHTNGVGRVSLEALRMTF